MVGTRKNPRRPEEGPVRTQEEYNVQILMHKNTTRCLANRVYAFFGTAVALFYLGILNSEYKEYGLTGMLNIDKCLSRKGSLAVCVRKCLVGRVREAGLACMVADLYLLMVDFTAHFLCFNVDPWIYDEISVWLEENPVISKLAIKLAAAAKNKGDPSWIAKAELPDSDYAYVLSLPTQQVPWRRIKMEADNQLIEDRCEELRISDEKEKRTRGLIDSLLVQIQSETSQPDIDALEKELVRLRKMLPVEPSLALTPEDVVKWVAELDE